MAFFIHYPIAAKVTPVPWRQEARKPIRWERRTTRLSLEGVTTA
jgi:hypothetical protein